MKKIFKSKKRLIIKKIKLIKYIIISFFVSYFLVKTNIFNKDEFINYLSYTSVNKINKIKLNFKGNYLLNIGLSNFNKYNFINETKINKINSSKLKTRIYIYNTHQTEEYGAIKEYNIIPTVYTASYVLKDKLNDLNIGSIVEDSNLKNDLNNAGYTYNNAYKISREWLMKLNNNNLDLYIDLHRDSVKYDLSNVAVGTKDYAKIMFVVGTNYDYKNNYDIANNILKEIVNIIPDISRGIFTRNSVYNQDFNKNCVLIEIGGPESSLESVINSIEVLSHAIKNYLGE